MKKVWLPGSQIPGEPDLCKLLGSADCVRQALRELELDGLIIRRKGKGTLFAEPKSVKPGAKINRIYQDMIERGIQPITRFFASRLSLPTRG